MTDTRVGPVLPGLRHVHSGKVRDSYALPDEPDLLLIIASDRISAYDHVLPTPIPDKGRVLTQLSLWWFDRLASAHGRQLGPHHVVSGDDPRIPAAVRGRAMLVRRLEMIPVECVARGYLAGSGLADYRTRGAVVDVALPPGLFEGSRLPEPIFTPATKAEQGAHDENVSYAAVQAAVGNATAAELRRRTLAVYQWAHDIARERGIVLADTKLEFGRPPGAPSGELVLGDEVLTPDSSRLWPADQWRAGRAQPSYDKQFLRDWLTSPASGWDRGSTDPPPPLPEEIVERTRQRYIDAYERLTGARFG